MEERRGSLIRIVEERRALEGQRSIQLGKQAGARIFNDQRNERFGDQELGERLHNAQTGHSRDYARAVWKGYVERAAEVFKQAQ